MDLVVHFFDPKPKTPKRTTKTLQQTKGFHHCKSLLSEGLMPSYGIVFFTTFIGRTCFASCLEGKKLSDLYKEFVLVDGRDIRICHLISRGWSYSHTVLVRSFDEHSKKRN